MATTDKEVRPGRERTILFGVGGVALLLGGAILYHYLTRPPQMGTSEEAFHTVDALYTAVRSQDENRLGECEQRLHALRDAGKLPEDAADALDAIIARARSGAWEDAAERLYEFMRAQRREGAIEPQPRGQDTKRKPTRTQGK